MLRLKSSEATAGESVLFVSEIQPKCWASEPICLSTALFRAESAPVCHFHLGYEEFRATSLLNTTQGLYEAHRALSSPVVKVPAMSEATPPWGASSPAPVGAGRGGDPSCRSGRGWGDLITPVTSALLISEPTVKFWKSPSIPHQWLWRK